MYLSELEIFGFKSFATKTKFKFSGGLAALVGPNGCGKTNIVDAIRWVLGEQKSSVLRSDSMEDVIFNGTATRKPLGMSEVTMIIENTRDILPSEYSTVSITRRLFRNGESSYYLNKSKCRLRDILDLFMDTGMGADSYSVIELKMVEAILSGKPEERRHLFEEAAGVTRYKLRRKEANNKLNKVQLDLDRVRDIVAEIQKNVNSLARQAAKTKRYNSLILELKDVEIAVIINEYLDWREKAKQFQNTINELETSKEEKEKFFEDLDSDIANLAETLNSIESAYSNIREKEIKTSSDIANKKQELAVSRERQNSLENSQIRIKNELAESKTSDSGIAENIHIAQEKIGFKKEELIISDELLVSKNEKRKEAHSMLDNVREKVNIFRQKLLSIQSNIETTKSIRNRNTQRRQSLEQKIQSSSEEIYKLNSQLGQLEEFSAKFANDKIELESNLSESQREFSIANEEKSSLQARFEQIRHEIYDLKNQISGKNASLNFLNSLIDSNEVSKFLLQSNAWQSSSKKTVLEEEIGADEKFRIAVESALGEAAHYIITDNKESAYNAFQALKEKNKGKATFICREMLSPVAAPAQLDKSSISDPSKVYGYLSEIVRVDDSLRFLLRSILSDMLVVEDLATAEEVVALSKAKSAVTLKGEIFSKNAVIKGGATLKEEGIAVGKNERIAQLSSEIAEINSQIVELEEEQKDIKSQIDEIDIPYLNSQIRHFENQIKDNENRSAQNQLKIQSIHNNLEMIEQNSSNFSDEIAEIAKEEENANLALEELQKGLELAKEEYAETEKNQKEYEQHYRELSDQARLAEMNSVQIKSEIRALENEIVRLSNQVENEKRKAELRQNELETNSALIFGLNNKIANLESELAALEEELAATINQRQSLEEDRKQTKEEFQVRQNELDRLRKDIDRLKDAIHKNELSLSEFNTHIQTLGEKAQETYQIDIYTGEYTRDPEFSIDEQKKVVAESKRKISELGNINFAALEEFDEQSERLSFYQNQVKDLVESEKILQETIQVINEEAERNFLNTFDQVRSNFKFLFAKLFSGDGQADIQMAEGNPLEANIEISAKPPGKRPQTIEQLSGGEKTLTAIALLFGIYMVKPSPFCILDEVDAPLDDANIGRFISMIKEFTDRTQFMIVTHNKKTMEAADTLYGITQKETGVSSIVSVRLDDQEVKIEAE